MKKKNKAKIILLACSSLILTSCASNNQTSGALFGTVTGALVGSAFGKGDGKVAATAIGAFLGGMICNNIGRNLDEKDRRMQHMAATSALEHNRTGMQSDWINPDTGHRGTVTPIKTFRNDNKYCREYMQTITVEGKQQKAYGAACRTPTGQWEIMR